MGACWSSAQYFTESLFDQSAWKNWNNHAARKYYEIGHLLGKGAFSEVRSTWLYCHEARENDCCCEWKTRDIARFL
jgi:hypothetical protein